VVASAATKCSGLASCKSLVELDTSSEGGD